MQTKFRESSISLVMFVFPSAQNNSAPTGLIFIQFDICSFFENLSWKFKFHYIRTRIVVLYMKTNTHFRSYLAQLFSEWEMFSEKSCRENQNQNFMPSDIFRKSCRLRDNAEQYCRAGQATDVIIIRCMGIARWILKSTDTNSKNAILISCPLQHWLK